MNNGLQQTGYANSRHNAVRHGVLSRHVVLRWEDGREYQALMDGLMAEYQPATATEYHLVEEIGLVIWRKARLVKAQTSNAHRVAEGLYEGFRGVQPVAFDRVKEPLATHDRVTVEGLLAFWHDVKFTALEDGLDAALAKLGQWQEEWQERHQQSGSSHQPAAPLLAVETFQTWVKGKIRHCTGLLAVDDANRAAQEQATTSASLASHGGRMMDLCRYETMLDRQLERKINLLLHLQGQRRMKERAALPPFIPTEPAATAGGTA